MHMMLDVQVEPNRSWRLKDEDEFEAMIARGLVQEATAHGLQAEANQVIERLERDQPPFSESWHLWRPDPAWTHPVLPEDWAEPAQPLAGPWSRNSQ